MTHHLPRVSVRLYPTTAMLRSTSSCVECRSTPWSHTGLPRQVLERQDREIPLQRSQCLPHRRGHPAVLCEFHCYKRDHPDIWRAILPTLSPVAQDSQSTL